MGIFTFQYVSIISQVPEDVKVNIPLFTFQYVSIISRHKRCRCKSCKIYIPICFYYFLLGWIQFFQALYHLHSNMFLLFLCPIHLYSRTEKNLHSNMFLLFHWGRTPSKYTSSIYIPICFYYFGMERATVFVALT